MSPWATGIAVGLQSRESQLHPALHLVQASTVPGNGKVLQIIFIRLCFGGFRSVSSLNLLSVWDGICSNWKRSLKNKSIEKRPKLNPGTFSSDSMKICHFPFKLQIGGRQISIPTMLNLTWINPSVLKPHHFGHLLQPWTTWVNQDPSFVCAVTAFNKQQMKIMLFQNGFWEF